MVQLSRNGVYRMRRDVFDHLTRLPVSFFDTHAVGDVLSVLSYDVDTISASLSNDLVQMLASIITVGGSFFMMLSISPRLMLVFVVTIPASVLFTRYRSKRVRPLFRERSARLGSLNGFAEEMTGGRERQSILADCVEAVIAAKLCLDGASVAGGSLYFVNPDIGVSSWFRLTRTYVTSIGDHDFYA